MTSDQSVITVGRQRPGQPGRWRLFLGQCDVGALALARSPRHARTRERRERGGFKAKIVDLDVDKGGRRRSRIRRQYRECHQKVVHKHEDLMVATWNVQGGNWSRTEERHVAKFSCLAEGMREGKIQARF